MIAAYRWTHSPSQLAWSEVQQLLVTVLHSSDELCELSRWLYHDDSTMNIVLCIGIVCYTSVYIARLSQMSPMRYVYTLVPRKQPSFQALFKEAKVLLCVEIVGQRVPNHRALLGGQQWRAGVVAQPSAAVWLTGDAAYRQRRWSVHVQLSTS